MDESRIRAEERARFKTILALPEAEGRLPLAYAIIAETDMTPEQAAAMLAASPIASSAPTGGNPFFDAMRAIGNPNVSPSGHDHG